MLRILANALQNIDQVRVRVNALQLSGGFRQSFAEVGDRRTQLCVLPLQNFDAAARLRLWRPSLRARILPAEVPSSSPSVAFSLTLDDDLGALDQCQQRGAAERVFPGTGLAPVANRPNSRGIESLNSTTL